MRILLQKVTHAAVTVDGETVGAIQQGYLLFLGVMCGDDEGKAQWLAEKIINLRLFESEDGTINGRSIVDVGGSIVVVSQFTLAGDVQKGNRPDYTAAAPREEAKRLYEIFMGILRAKGVTVQSGTFGAHMHVDLENDGPVTLLLER